MIEFSKDEVERLWPYLDDEQKREVLDHSFEIERLKKEWHPLPGPQTMAYESLADIVLYGGAAGGGKTDLALGKALTKHRRSLILRRVFPQLSGIIERADLIYSSYGKYRGSPTPVWNAKYNGIKRIIEFSTCQHEPDKKNFQGKPHDFIVFDEAANFLESQVSFIIGWNRHEDQKQHCQVLLASNPPTAAEGQWLFEWFSPWLDETYINPAKPGELRFFARVKGEFRAVADKTPFVIEGNEIVYDFNPEDYDETDIIKPKSRTYIPAYVTDNPYYMASGYMSTLQDMPEPLRSQMLRGDFLAGREDDAWQVIPTAWVKMAQQRWRDTPKPTGIPMTSIGVDPARGGADKTVFTLKYNTWVDKQISYPGESTPNGDMVAGLVFAQRKDDCQVIIDVIGIGSAVYDAIRRPIMDARSKTKIIGFNGAERSTSTDRTRQLTFFNKRSEWYWRMREALDPSTGDNICLPDDRELLADLCAPRWELAASGIRVEPKDDIIKRIGRSPDKGDSCIYAFVRDTSVVPQRTQFNLMGR